jgi:UDP-sulfoquinovose synthase
VWFSVRELAETVQKAAVELGLQCDIESVPNPRTEAESHYYNPVHTKLLDLGLQPTLLSDDLVQHTLNVLMRHSDRAVVEAIAPKTTWG